MAIYKPDDDDDSYFENDVCGIDAHAQASRIVSRKDLGVLLEEKDAFRSIFFVVERSGEFRSDGCRTRQSSNSSLCGKPVQPAGSTTDAGFDIRIVLSTLGRSRSTKELSTVTCMATSCSFALSIIVLRVRLHSQIG